jgi:hypothetical protein
MTDEQLVNTLEIAAISPDVRANLALEVLLKISAERIDELSKQVKELRQQANPERIG